jgi:hypothetical protein
MLLYVYACVLPICALLMVLYPLLRRKTLPLSRALRHSTVLSVLLLAASHLMLLVAYVQVKEQLWDKVLPIPMVGLVLAGMFVLSCVILAAIFACSRSLLRKLLLQE